MAYAAADPIETHVDDFLGGLLFDTVINDTSCCAAVGLDRPREQASLPLWKRDATSDSAAPERTSFNIWQQMWMAPLEGRFGSVGRSGFDGSKGQLLK